MLEIPAEVHARILHPAAAEAPAERDLPDSYGMATNRTLFRRVARNRSRSAHDTTTLAVLMFGWKISRSAPFRS